jgi:Fic family protein
MGFEPRYIISSQVAQNLMRIEAARQVVATLPLNEHVLAGLRQSARLISTHYSTQIEGNRLTRVQVEQVLIRHQKIPQRQRDEKEVKGYYSALEYAESYAADHETITEAFIRKLHALVMAGGDPRRKPTPYRDGQNVIRNSLSGAIVYMPPEAADVPKLMKDMVDWINAHTADVPIPVVAAVAHYQFATIHPYYDGNGRVARLLTNTVLHQHGYGLRGIYNLEEYYARNLREYYAALDVGQGHNYYMGRAESDISGWIEYFITGMTASFEAVCEKMRQSAPAGDRSDWIRSLDARQRKVLPLFEEWDEITTSQIAELLKLSPRGARAIAQKWVESGFLAIANPSKRKRTYTLVRPTL